MSDDSGKAILLTFYKNEQFVLSDVIFKSRSRHFLKRNPF